MTRGDPGLGTAVVLDRGLPPAVLRRVTVVLCVTEIVSWGVLFYAFPVLVGSISTEEGWPMVWLVAAFTLALVTSGVCGVWVGRHIDRAGPRAVMTGGSALAVVAVVALAGSPSLPVFVAASLLVGVAMAATLYAPAFAAVTGWSGDEARRRVRSLTVITLVAGLASTVFAPLTAFLLSHLGWRETYLVLATVLLATVPLHAYGLRPRWTTTRTWRASEGDRGAGARPADFDGRAFAFLVAGMALAGFAVHAVVINLVPLLTHNGLTTAEAATALGIGGVGQVVGRIFYGPALSRLGPTARAVTAVAGVVATTGALALWQSPFAFVCVLSFLSGTARGVFTLVQATAVVDRWGVGDIGHRNGILSGAVTVVAAFAPWVGAVLAAVLGSYDATFAVLAGLAVASVLVLLAGAVRRPRTWSSLTRPAVLPRAWRHAAPRGRR